MTKQQVLDALENLKELTNDNGKRSIDGIKAGVYVLEEPAPIPEPYHPLVHLEPEESLDVKFPLPPFMKKKGAKK